MSSFFCEVSFSLVTSNERCECVQCIFFSFCVCLCVVYKCLNRYCVVSQNGVCSSTFNVQRYSLASLIPDWPQLKKTEVPFFIKKHASHCLLLFLYLYALIVALALAASRLHLETHPYTLKKEFAIFFSRKWKLKVTSSTG